MLKQPWRGGEETTGQPVSREFARVVSHRDDAQHPRRRRRVGETVDQILKRKICTCTRSPPTHPALDIHEERVRRLNQSLELVLASLQSGRRVKQINVLGENLRRERERFRAVSMRVNRAWNTSISPPRRASRLHARRRRQNPPSIPLHSQFRVTRRSSLCALRRRRATRSTTTKRRCATHETSVINLVSSFESSSPTYHLVCLLDARLGKADARPRLRHSFLCASVRARFVVCSDMWTTTSHDESSLVKSSKGRCVHFLQAHIRTRT